jgi:uncharacterized membrane protein
VVSALFAFLHHVAAFTLVATLAVEFALLRGALTHERARHVLAADFIFGAASGAIAGWDPNWISGKSALPSATRRND